MKKIFLSLCLLLVTIIASAQIENSKTKIEVAVNTRDFLYKQEVFSVDNIDAFRIDALKITNLESFNIVSGLRVVHRIKIGKEFKTFYNYIDATEIDGLITTLRYVKTILKSKTTPNNYTEIKYTTLAGFQFMLSTILNDQSKLDWKFTVQTNTTNAQTNISLTNDEIDKLLKTLEQAKTKL